MRARWVIFFLLDTLLCLGPNIPGGVAPSMGNVSNLTLATEWKEITRSAGIITRNPILMEIKIGTGKGGVITQALWQWAEPQTANTGMLYFAEKRNGKYTVNKALTTYVPRSVSLESAIKAIDLYKISNVFLDHDYASVLLRPSPDASFSLTTAKHILVEGKAQVPEQDLIEKDYIEDLFSSKNVTIQYLFALH